MTTSERTEDMAEAATARDEATAGKPDDLLSAAEVGAYLEPPVSGESIRSYASKGRMPAPDRRFGQAPAWYRSTIDAWKASRPGRGVRTAAKGAEQPHDDEPASAAIASLPTVAETQAARRERMISESAARGDGGKKDKPKGSRRG